MRPEEFEHFMIVDLGIATALQDDWRMVIEPINNNGTDGSIEYNGMKIIPYGVMIGRNMQNYSEPFKPDMFDKLGKTAIFADPSSKYVETLFVGDPFSVFEKN